MRRLLSLVDDEHGQLFGFGDKPCDFALDGAVRGGAGAFGGQAELPADALVHVEHVAGRERHVADAVQARMQGLGDVPAHSGLAAADFPGQQPDAAQFDEVVEPRLGLAAGGRLEQLVGVLGGGERAAGEGEVAQVHYVVSFSLRIASGDGGGTGGGSLGLTCQEGRSRLTAVLA